MVKMNLDLHTLLESIEKQDYQVKRHGNNHFTITSPDGQHELPFDANVKGTSGGDAAKQLTEQMQQRFSWADTTLRDGDDLETQFKKLCAARELERLTDPNWDPTAIERAERQADEQIANNRITFSFEKITPWVAFQLLAAHEKARIARGLSEDAELDIRAVLEGEPFVRQRKVSKRHKKDLGQIIRLGQFMLTHQGIAIADDGYCLDGQHRLKTILDEGLSAALTVARHVPNEIFPVIDAGMKRTPEQIAGMLGFSNGGAVTAAVRILYFYDNEPTWKKWHSRTISAQEIIELIKDQYTTIEESLRLTQRGLKGGTLSINLGVATALTHIILRADPRAPIEQFWHTAGAADTPDAYWLNLYGPTFIKECPIFAFRRWTAGWSKRPGKGNLKGQRHTEFLITGMNTYNKAINGERALNVQFRESCDVPVPAIAGHGIA